MDWQDGVLYAVQVAKGEIEVCRNIKLVCQRFLNQLENKEWEWFFDPDYPQHFLDFIAELKHTKGPDAGTPIVLQPWQIFLICAIYGFRAKKDPQTRMVRDVIVFIPRKAGKSTLTSAIGLYELVFGEAGPEVFTLATNREQATIVFDSAKGFVESAPDDIANWFNVSKYELKKVGDSQSMFKALSRDTKKTGDGKNPSCVIIDEAAQIVDRNSIEVLHSGMVARKNPLRIYITTASFTKETKFFEDMQYLKSMLRGQAEDNPRWFGLMYGLDEGDDWKDPKIWEKVNPMHGISINAEAIEQRVKEAQAKPSALNELLCKTFNVYVSANSAWIDRSHWDDSPNFDEGKIPEASFVAFDLAATRDLNAVATLHRYNEEDYGIEFKFFLPEESLDLIPNHYRPIFLQAVQRGSLKLTQGNVADYVEVEDYVVQQVEKYNAKEIGYDAWNAAALVSKLYEKGLPVKKIGQGMGVLNNPSKAVEKLILGKCIAHEHDPFVGWQLGNCEVYTDVNGNIKVRKNEADNSAKVDGIIAMIMAFHCALDNPFLSDSFGFRTF